MILTGRSLGKRQKELNENVKDAVTKNISFEDVKKLPEVTDIDKLYKIDVASNCKNIDYLLDILKSGDELCISRVLKCDWLYDDKYDSFVNPKYLNENIFPFMSARMKKKSLTRVYMNIRNTERVKDFYIYCLDAGLKPLALKFLVFTSADYKQYIFEQNFQSITWAFEYEISEFALVIGDNFKLLNAFLSNATQPYSHIKSRVVHELRGLYSIDPDKYLDLCEQYPNSSKTLGLRMSKHFMKNHKSRIVKHCSLYCKLINSKVFGKYTTPDEAKIYAAVLLPESASEFWKCGFNKLYSIILEIIPKEERYIHIRKIFKDKYPDDEFESTEQFYTQGYHKEMTIEQREQWALNHLANPNKTFLSRQSNDREYVWYKYVNYDKAIEGIKKYILITAEPSRRSEIVKTLIESARNQEQLEKLFKYYFERHINEKRSTKEYFVGQVIEVHKVWDFNSTCWAAFNQILHSLEIYNPQFDHWGFQSTSIFVNALIYHVINKIEIPEALKKFAESDLQWYHIKNVVDRINTPSQKETLYQYLLHLNAEKIKTRFDGKQYDDEIQKQLRVYINNIQEIIRYFEKSDSELPAIVVKYMKLDPIYFKKPIKSKKITQEVLIRDLKNASAVFLSNISQIYKAIEDNMQFKLNTLLQKLRTYFPHDLTKDLLDNFIKSIPEKDNHTFLFNAVCYVFILADERVKVQLMEQYAPTDPKIDYSYTKRNKLYVQEAICRFAGYSRAPVPLENIRAYIKGDYVHFCLPLFNMYLTKLRPQELLQFVEPLLDAPVSIQKHGLRLAFKCFEVDILKNLIHNIWKKQKNISLRKLIYTNLLSKLKGESGKLQKELFNVFLTLTLDIHPDDHEDVINLLTSVREIPEVLRSAYLDIAWKTVSKFPDAQGSNLEHKRHVIRNMMDADETVVRPVIDSIIQELFVNKRIIPSDAEIKTIPDHLHKDWIDFNSAKIQLIKDFVLQSKNRDSAIDVVKIFLRHCFDMWSIPSVRCFCIEFVKGLVMERRFANDVNFREINNLFKTVLQELEKSTSLFETYELLWSIRILFVTDAVLLKTRDFVGRDDDKQHLSEISKFYGEELLKIVKYFVDKNVFFVSFLTVITSIIQDSISVIQRNLKNRDSIEDSFIEASVAKYLFGSGIKEAVLLAVTLLPVGNENTVYSQELSKIISEFESALTKLTSFENVEIQTLLHRKLLVRNLSKTYRFY